MPILHTAQTCNSVTDFRASVWVPKIAKVRRRLYGLSLIMIYFVVTPVTPGRNLKVNFESGRFCHHRCRVSCLWTCDRCLTRKMSKIASKLRNPSPLEVQRRATQQQILQTNLTVLVRHDPRFGRQAQNPCHLPYPPLPPLPPLFPPGGGRH